MSTPTSSRRTVLALAGIAAVALSGIYWFGGQERKATSEEAGAGSGAGGLPRSLATGSMAALLVHDERKSIPPLAFKTGEGQDMTLERWKGRVVLLNLWATWCAPCRKEMPDLNMLQKALGSADFEVVALSLDRKGSDASGIFLKETNADSLALYVDQTAEALGTLQVPGLPATLLIDRQGKEAARLLGPAAWASPEAQAVIKALMAEAH
jgi:thiol-disulfide isomerase/thioredoxin